MATTPSREIMSLKEMTLDLRDCAGSLRKEVNAKLLKHQTQKDLRESLRNLRKAMATWQSVAADIEYQLDVRNDMTRSRMLKRG